MDLVELVRSVVEELRRDGVLSANIEIEDILPPEVFIVGDETQLRNAVCRVVRERRVKPSRTTAKLHYRAAKRRIRRSCASPIPAPGFRRRDATRL